MEWDLITKYEQKNQNALSSTRTTGLD